jgi:hypothetical protein
MKTLLKSLLNCMQVRAVRVLVATEPAAPLRAMEGALAAVALAHTRLEQQVQPPPHPTGARATPFRWLEHPRMPCSIARCVQHSTVWYPTGMASAGRIGGCLKARGVSTSREPTSSTLNITWSRELFEGKGRFHLPCEPTRSLSLSHHPLLMDFPSERRPCARVRGGRESPAGPRYAAGLPGGGRRRPAAGRAARRARAGELLPAPVSPGPVTYKSGYRGRRGAAGLGYRCTVLAGCFGI